MQTESFFQRSEMALSFDERIEFEVVDSPEKPEESKAEFRWVNGETSEPAAFVMEFELKAGSFQGARFELPQVEDAAGLIIRTKGAPGSGLFVRLTDATGQEHSRPYAFNGEWQSLEWRFAQPDHGPEPFLSNHSGGADDGVVHLPLKDVLLAQAETQDAAGALAVSEVRYGFDEIDREEVVIDAGQASGPVRYIGSGFLHGNTATEPPEEWVAPLKPRLIRSRLRRLDDSSQYKGKDFFDRVAAWGAPMQVVISDEYGQHRKKRGTAWPGDDGDWETWKECIDALIDHVDSLGVEVEWDIWNEPDYSQFWKSTKERFLETWTRGVRRLRERKPDAVIIGPSFSKFCRPYLEQFLLHAQREGVLPDIVCWHELNWLYRDYTAFEAHAAYIRSFMREHGMPPRPIDINEYVIQPHAMNPGAHMWYIAALERMDLRGTCHAIWKEPDPPEDAPPVTLCNLLTPTRPPRPRSIWQLYRAYAEHSGEMVPVHPGPSVNGTASVDAVDKRLLILLGRDEASSTPVRVHLKDADHGMGASRAELRIERIPYRGFDPVDAPEEVRGETVELSSEMDVDLPEFQNGEAIVITLTAAGQIPGA